MLHDVTLIVTFALGFALAFLLGYCANRLRLPPLVGYLIAGVVIGVFTPGVVAGHVPDAGPDGQSPGLLLSLGATLVKVAAFAAIALLLRPRVLPWILRQVARTGSRELFTLAILALSVGIAFGSAALFGVSLALGAFFAGVVLNESDLSRKAATNSLPLQDAFAVLFFVSVGMLFDPSIILRQPLMLVAVLSLIRVGKSLIALAVVMVLGYPASTALTVSAALAQIGEFSFILAGLGIAYGLLPAEGLSLVLAGAIVSITCNKFAFLAIDRANAWVCKSRPRRRMLEDFLSSGEVEVSVGGRRIRLGPGSFFGEMALISGQPRSAHVTALDYCSLLKLRTRDFNEIMRRHPEIRRQVEALAAERGAMNSEAVQTAAPSE